jgi:hypothetical protein
MCFVVLLRRSNISSFSFSSFFVIPSITPYSISIFSLTPRHSTNCLSFISYRKIFEAFDGETIAAMDPESFAEYLGSQSLLDMMAGAGAGAGGGELDMGRGWNKDTDTINTSNHVST